MKCVLIVQYPALKKSFKKASIKSVCKNQTSLTPLRIYVHMYIISDHPLTIYFEWRFIWMDNFDRNKQNLSFMFSEFVRLIQNIFIKHQICRGSVETCNIPNLKIYLIGQSWPDWYALSHMVPTLQLDSCANWQAQLKLTWF